CSPSEPAARRRRPAPARPGARSPSPWPHSAGAPSSAPRAAVPRGAADRPSLVPLDDAHEIGHEAANEAHRADRARVVHATRADDADVPDHAAARPAVPAEHEAAVEQRLDTVLRADGDVDLALADDGRQELGEPGAIFQERDHLPESRRIPRAEFGLREDVLDAV